MLYRLHETINQGAENDQDKIRLFERGGTTLTEQGGILASAALDVINAVNAWASLVDNLKSPRTAVRIACYPSQAPLVASASKLLESSDITLEILGIEDAFRHAAGDELRQAVLEGNADIAMGPGATRTKGLGQRYLYDWRLAAVLSEDSAFYGRKSVELGDLRQIPLLVSPESHYSRSLLSGDDTGLRFVIESASVDALCSLARLGFGTALVAGDAIPVRTAPENERENWPIVERRGLPIGGANYAMYRATKHRDMTAVDEVVSALVKACHTDVAEARNKFVDRYSDEGASRRSLR
jgi:DNA-binding transcriptional LysR family regulator